MLELARSIEHPFSLAYALHHTSWLYQYLRMPEEALVVCGEQLRFTADQGFPLFHATGIIYEAGGSSMRGQAKQALPRLISGLDAYRATGAALALPYYFGLLGSVLINSGRLAEAGDALNKALSVAEESHDRCHEAELHRLKGELVLRQRQSLRRLSGTFDDPSRSPRSNEAKPGNSAPRQVLRAFTSHRSATLKAATCCPTCTRHSPKDCEHRTSKTPRGSLLN